MKLQTDFTGTTIKTTNGRIFFIYDIVRVYDKFTRIKEYNSSWPGRWKIIDDFDQRQDAVMYVKSLEV